MPDFVKIVNDDRKPFDFMQNNAKRVINPGEDVIVPWNIAATLFGDPNIPDIPPVNERTRMYGKVRARLNFSNGLMTEAQWEEIRPRCRVFDLEDNREIIMLIDDPAGEHMGSFSPSPAPSKQTDVEAMQRQIAALTAQVERLVTVATGAPQEAAQSGTSDSPTVTADSPGGQPSGQPSGQPDEQQGIDPVFDIPTEDNPQATPVGDIETATEDNPAPVKKTATKKVAAKKTAAARK